MLSRVLVNINAPERSHLPNSYTGSCVRIGVCPYLDPNGGGIYEYSLSILQSLENWKTEDELLLVSLKGAQSIPRYLDLRKWEIRSLDLDPPSSTLLDNLRKVIGKGPHRDAWRFLRTKMGQTFNSEQKAVNLDLVRLRP